MLCKDISDLDDTNEDFDQIVYCDTPGCTKRFAHDHVSTMSNISSMTF